MDQALVDRAADMIVIRADGAALRSEPRDKAAVTAELRAADIVAHVDDLPDWTKVRLASGLEGWVEKRAVFALTR